MTSFPLLHRRQQLRQQDQIPDPSRRKKFQCDWLLASHRRVILLSSLYNSVIPRSMAKSSEGRRDLKIPGLPLRPSAFGNPMKWPDLHNDHCSPKIQRTLHCAQQSRSWFENTSVYDTTLSRDQNSFPSSPQPYNPASTTRILNLQQDIPKSQTRKKTQDAHQAPERASPRSVSRSQSQQRDPM